MRREHPLHRLLWPQSIAVIGASPDRSKLRGKFVSSLQDGGYTGDILPITSSYSEIEGLPTRPTIDSVEAPPDLAILAIPADATIPELVRCAAAGVRSAIVVTSGFAEGEAGSRAAQDEMTAIARSSGMRICGPNNVGLYNAVGNVAATFSQTLAASRGGDDLSVGGKKIAILSQSGAVGFGLFGAGRGRGLDFSYVVTTGNEADVTISELLDYVVEDAATGVVLIFCESIRDPEVFEAAAARAVVAGKPVVAIKAGRTDAGRRATASHTASLSGWNVAYEAVFRRYGILAADSLEEATALAAILATGPAPVTSRTAIVTVSGGLGALVCDELERNGLSVPELGGDLEGKLRRHIPPYGSAHNPVDVTASGVTGGGLTASMSLLEQDDDIDIVAVAATLASEDAFTFDHDDVQAIVRRGRKPLIFYSCTTPVRSMLVKLANAGVFVHDDLTTLAAALARLVTAGSATASGHTRDLEPVPSVQRVLADTGSGPIPEHRTKQMLAKLGFPDPADRLVGDQDGARRAAASLGYPVALKIQSAALAHKSDVGGVILNVRSAAEVGPAFESVMSAAESVIPKEQIDGVSVQRMAPPGVEFIVGMVVDPTFGPLIMVGAGGVAVEVFKDVAYGLAPLDAEQARQMVLALRSSVFLTGFRGSKAIPFEPLIDTIVHVSEIAAGSGSALQELELNPVIVHSDGSGLSLVDALGRLDLTATRQPSERSGEVR